MQWAYVNIACVVGATAAKVGGIIVGIVATAGAAYGVWYLSEHRVFY